MRFFHSFFLLSLCAIIVPSVLRAQKPTVDFTADKVVGCAPLTVSFSDKSSVDVIDWQWDVDGNGSVDYVADPEPTHTYLSPGLYTVKLVVMNFVDSAVLVRTRYIRVTSAPSVTIPQQSVCRGDSISIRPTIFGGVRPFTYFWSAVDFPFVSTDSIPKFGPDTTRMWTLTITDSVGCTTETPFAILVKPGPDKPLIERTGFTLTSSTIASRYQWFLNGKAISGAISRSYSYDTSKVKSGWILVEVRDVNGCTSRSDSLQLGTIASVNDDEQMSWIAYPNPVSDRLSVSGLSCVPQDVEIFSMLGERVGVVAPDIRGNSCSISMAELPAGTYIVGIRCNENRRFLRIIKQ